jgi:hypothetical protein
MSRGNRRSILFLDGPSPAFKEPKIEVTRGLFLHKIDKTLLTQFERAGAPNAVSLAGDCKVCVVMEGTASTEDLLRPDAFHTALVLASDIRCQEKASIIIDRERGGATSTTMGTSFPARGSVLWGHHRDALNLDDIESAKRLMPRIEKLQPLETFSRVGNALLFYKNGYNSDNPDLALIAFATCLESLFSTAEQELSFRLSLRVATFLADKMADRRELFEESKEVYRIRSKVVHGAAINRDSEQAAIYLVEGILPRAERFARRALKKVLELQIERLFENASRLNSFFDGLLFSESLEKALEQIRVQP